MLEVAGLLLPLISALWWPFARSMAMLTTAPILGEDYVPLPVRALLSVALAFMMLPLTKGAVMPDPFSLAGVLAMVEQAVIGGVIGLALQLTMAVVAMLGFLASSQIGFSMAQMNDPVNGQNSDVISGLLGLVAILVFFGIDGHLVLVGVLGQSFRAWPPGAGYGPLLFLNRVAPSLNLFSLGFSVVTLFGLMMLMQVVRFVPEHYVQMTNQVLEMLQQQMGAAHG
jgi:flagellar biosynthetic protein FliR